jgi:hypothetical protein
MPTHEGSAIDPVPEEAGDVVFEVRGLSVS